MHTYKYEIMVKSDGSLDFHKKIPTIKGKKVKIIIIASGTNKELSTEEIMKAADKDWFEWHNSEEDIYEDYRRYLPKR